MKSFQQSQNQMKISLGYRWNLIKSIFIVLTWFILVSFICLIQNF